MIQYNLTTKQKDHAKITVDSGLATYSFKLPAQNK